MDRSTPLYLIHVALYVRAILGNNLSELFASMAGGLRWRHPFQGRSGASSYTGRLKSLIQPVLAIVAFENAPIIPVPLWSAPGTCGDAGLAADAHGGIHKDYSIFSSLLHGAGWACGHAPRVLAMETGHKNELNAGDVALHVRSNRNDLAETWPHLDVVLGLAMNFTRPAADTP